MWLIVEPCKWWKLTRSQQLVSSGSFEFQYSKYFSYASADVRKLTWSGHRTRCAVIVVDSGFRYSSGQLGFSRESEKAGAGE